MPVVRARDPVARYADAVGDDEGPRAEGLGEAKTARTPVVIPDAAATGAVTVLGATYGVAIGFGLGGMYVLGKRASTAVPALLTLGVVLVVGLGAWLFVKRRRQKARAARAAAGGAPWTVDFSGPPGMAVRGVWHRGLPPAAFLLSSGSVGAMARGAEYLISGAWTGYRGVMSFVAASCVTALAILVYRAMQQGGVQVRCPQVPQVPGTRATFFVAMTAGGSRLRDTRLVLRCWGPRTGKPPGIVWSQEVNPHDDASPGPEEFVEVAFDIPAGLPSNAPHAKKPVHWHLVVAGRTNWGKVVEFMPVPVYDTAGASPDATGGAR